MQSIDAVNAAHHKYHEDNFTIWNPGLAAPPSTAHFATCLDKQPARLYCERRPGYVDTKGVRAEKPAIIIEMKASLRKEPGFYFTFDGDRYEPGFESEAGEQHMHACCWLGPPTETGIENAIENIVWRRGLRHLKEIGDENRCATSELVQGDPDKVVGSATDLDLLQIYWTPSFVAKADVKGTRKSPMSHMPVFDASEHRRPFETLDDVPFGSQVRIRFTLESGRPAYSDESRPEIAAARLLALHIL